MWQCMMNIESSYRQFCPSQHWCDNIVYHFAAISRGYQHLFLIEMNWLLTGKQYLSSTYLVRLLCITLVLLNVVERIDLDWIRTVKHFWIDAMYCVGLNGIKNFGASPLSHVNIIAKGIQIFSIFA